MYIDLTPHFEAILTIPWKDGWKDAIEVAKNLNFLNTEESLVKAREHFKQFGAWSEEEIARWRKIELQALILQDIANNIMEVQHQIRREYNLLSWDPDDLDDLCWIVSKDEDYHEFNLSSQLFYDDSDQPYIEYYLGV